MGTFNQALHRHQSVADAARQDMTMAGDLWNAVAGIGTDRQGTFAEAVRDTAPVEHAALLATDEVATASAFGILWEGTARSSGLSPFELRDLGRGLWARFGEQAKRTQRLSESFGWDLASAWTQSREVELAAGDMAQVERIARLAGRMYASLRGARARRVHGVPAEVYSV